MFLASVSLSLFCAVTTTAFADDKNADLQQSIDQLQRKLDEKKQPRKEKAPPPARKTDGFASVQEALTREHPSDVQESPPGDDDTPETAPLTVTAHLRVKSGVGFPSPEEIVLPPVPDYTPDISVSEPARWESPPSKPERPSRCEKNFTNRILRYPDLDDTTIVHERIYLSQDLVPLDVSEVYGPTVRLYPYGGENSDVENERMALDRVPCVPFRLRLTAAALYEDYGTAALKNYSTKPSGDGVMHTWVEQKLYGKR